MDSGFVPSVHDFDKKLTEADAYLQILIDQLKVSQQTGVVIALWGFMAALKHLYRMNAILPAKDVLVTCLELRDMAQVLQICGFPEHSFQCTWKRSKIALDACV